MKLLDWLFAARPMLHLPVWSIYLVSLHYHLRLSGESFRLSDIGMLGCLTLITAGAYFVNQIYDLETDRINNKLGFIDSDKLTVAQLTIAWLICSLFALATGPFWSIFITFIFGQLVLLGWLYSVPPARLKDRPFGGLFANAYSFGFLIPFTVMPEMTQHNAGLLGWDNPFYFFFAVAGIHMFTTLPDRDGDRATGKKTIAVIWPAWLVRLSGTLLLLLASWFAWRSGHGWLVYVALMSAIVGFGAFIAAHPRFDLVATKLPILLLTAVAAWWFPGYLLFLVVLFAVTRLYYRKRFNLVYPRLT